MATLTRSITIDAPVETVFDYALDISQLWRSKDVALTEIELKPTYEEPKETRQSRAGRDCFAPLPPGSQ